MAAGKDNATAFSRQCEQKTVIFAGNHRRLLVRGGLMFTGMFVAASFLITGVIAFTYLKNG